MSDEWDEIDKALDAERPEAWIAENEGDTLKGSVVGYEEAFGQFGPETICLIDTGDTVMALWLYGAVLKDSFAKLKPQIGERIGVRYLGKRQGENSPNPYKMWKVVVPGRMGKTPNFAAWKGGEEDTTPEQAEADAAAFDPEEQGVPAQALAEPNPVSDPSETPPTTGFPGMKNLPISEMQLTMIRELETRLGRPPGDYTEAGVTRGEAEDYITLLSEELAK